MRRAIQLLAQGRCAFGEGTAFSRCQCVSHSLNLHPPPQLRRLAVVYTSFLTIHGNNTELEADFSDSPVRPLAVAAGSFLAKKKIIIKVL